MTVRLDVERDIILINGSEYPASRDTGYDSYMLPTQPAPEASIAQVRAALSRAARLPASGPRADSCIIELPLVDGKVTENEEYIYQAVRLELLGSGDMVLHVTCLVLEEHETADEELLKRMLETFAEARGSSVLSWFQWENDGYDFYDATLSVAKRGTTIQDAARLGRDAVALFEATRDGVSSPEATLDVLRAGRADVLLGQYESAWLEAKGHGGYDLAKNADAIEFAQDVARFANAEGGGLLVVGLGTKKDSVGDRIRSVQPLPARPPTARYRAIADRRIYPPVDGLTIEAVQADSTGSGWLLCVYVPPQPERLKPFLVTGAVISGKVEGAFLSIVRRRGEDSIPVSAPAIHQLLAAGRALLERGTIPPDDPA